MPKTFENCLGLVNGCIYYALQTCEILPDTALLSGFPSSPGAYWVRQYSVNLVLFVIKYRQTSEMTIKLKSNLYVRPVNIFPNFWHCPCCLAMTGRT